MVHDPWVTVLVTLLVLEGLGCILGHFSSKTVAITKLSLVLTNYILIISSYFAANFSRLVKQYIE